MGTGSLRSLLRGTSVTAVKHWLKVNDYRHSSSNSQEHFKLLESLVEEGTIEREEIVEAAIAFEENGTKEIYLYNAETSFSSKRELVRYLGSSGISLSDSRSLASKEESATGPSLCYVVWEEGKKGGEIRIKYSETQVDVKVDKQEPSINEEAVTKTVVIVHYVSTGWTEIRYDSPADRHSHTNAEGRSSDKLYRQYYREKALAMLNLPQLGLVDLGPAMEWLATTAPRVFRMPDLNLRSGYNTKVRYSAPSKEADIRDDPAYAAAADEDEENWVREQMRGYWVEEHSKGKLHRDLYMTLRADGVITFRRDCLPDEVDYAISELRKV